MNLFRIQSQHIAQNSGSYQYDVVNINYMRAEIIETVDTHIMNNIQHTIEQTHSAIITIESHCVYEYIGFVLFLAMINVLPFYETPTTRSE